MQSLGLLFSVILLGTGLLLNTAVLLFFLIRSVHALLSARSSPAVAQGIRLAHEQR